MGTLTKIAGVSCLGPEVYYASYTVQLGTTSGAGLDAIDLTADFSYVHMIVCGGNDTADDNTYSIKAIHPGAAVAVASDNVDLEVREISDASTVDTTDLSAVAGLQMMVFGKRA